MKILLTGATGFIGRHLVPLLLDAGHELTVLVRQPGQLVAESGSSRVTEVEGHLLDEASLALACQGQELIIHLAALAHITHTRPEEHWRIGYQGTHALWCAAQAAGVERLLFISTSKASSAREATAYARSKAAAEAMLQANAGAGPEICILRPAVVYGPGMRGNLASWIRHCRRDVAPPLPADCASLHMVSLEGVCRQILRALRDEALWGRTWWLADPRPYHLKDLEKQIRAAAGRRPINRGLPAWCWWLAGYAGDLVFLFSGKRIGISRHSCRTLFRDEVPDPSVPRLVPEGEDENGFSRALPALIASIKDSDKTI